MNTLGSDIYGYYYNYRSDNSKYRYYKEYYDNYPSTELSKCPSCCMYKTPKRMSNQYCSRYCFSCANKLNITINKANNFIKSCGNKNGLKMALRKMLRMLGELDGSVEKVAGWAEDVLIDNNIHIAMGIDDDDINKIASHKDRYGDRFFNSYIKSSFKTYRRGGVDGNNSHPLPASFIQGKVNIHYY